PRFARGHLTETAPPGAPRPWRTRTRGGGAAAACAGEPIPFGRARRPGACARRRRRAAGLAVRLQRAPGASTTGRRARRRAPHRRAAFTAKRVLQITLCKTLFAI